MTKQPRISRTAKTTIGGTFRIHNEGRAWDGSRYTRAWGVVEVNGYEHYFSKKELVKLYHGILKLLMITMED